MDEFNLVNAGQNQPVQPATPARPQANQQTSWPGPNQQTSWPGPAAANLPTRPQMPTIDQSARLQVPTINRSARSGGTGSIIGAIIIILLLAAGAFYFWGAKLNSTDNNPPPLILGNETADANASGDTASGLPPQQTSDDEAAINSDIQAMNIDQLNAQNDASLQTYGAATQ